MAQQLPNPPVLKTTIIQLNKELDSDDNNYEILTNDYLNTDGSPSGLEAGNELNFAQAANSASAMPNKKKRRRSSANIDSEELAKRKHETKQLHSIIEKRRRIKINREFEALKYLIPACRNITAATGPTGSNSPTSGPKKSAASSNSSNNNGNKIDGMYKLTILKSSVEYILYLHHIIQKQHQLLLSENSNPEYKNFDIDFAKIPLNVNQYRNIDKEFNFKDLLGDLDEGEVPVSSSSSTSSSSNGTPTASSTLGAKKNFDFRNHVIEEEEEEEEEEYRDEEMSASSSVVTSTAPTSKHSSISLNTKNQLPSPDITPDMAPILTLLNKYSSQGANHLREPRKNSFPISPNTMVIHSTNSSPFANPLKSTLSTPLMQRASSTSPPYKFQRSTSNASTNKFSLPDPAINPASQLNDLPKKKYFKSKVPVNNTIMFNSSSKSDEEYNDERLSDQDASKTLLALRKSSIDSLLN
ncbi:uncharacterized protein RJT20DRAFT_132816 [Scheffersomyces xylosifermentans]|uniref:uncharacterized protein n=1 Tax=Scheffersomyces xylosifermentans TaxID=1304137 RepID=UPI00315DD750